MQQTLAGVLARPITLDDAVRVALLNSPKLMRAYRELGVAPADLVRSGLFAKTGQPFKYERDLLRVEHANARLRLARLMGLSADRLPERTAGLPTLPDALPVSGQFAHTAWLNRADARTAEAALRAENPFGAPVPNPEYRDVLPLVSPSRVLPTQARLPQAEIDVLDARHRIAAEIGDAEGRMRIAHAKAVKLNTLILPARTEVTDEALKHYNGMLIGVYEVLDAKREEIEKQGEYVQAVRNFWKAYFDLERAVGGSDASSRGAANHL
ncbi:MAG: hypothetical protein ACOZDY_12315 [Pseudomonadota bacterium]